MGANAASPVEGFYAGVGVGGTYTKVDNSNTTERKESDFGYKITGGYRLNKNVGLELAYADLGKVSAVATNAIALVNNVPSALKGTYRFKNAYTASIVGTLPLANKLEAFGRLGIYNVQSELGLEAGGVSATLAKKHYTGANVGLGLNYELTPNLNLKGEWESYTGVKTPSYTTTAGTISEDKGDVNLFTAGLSYKF